MVESTIITITNEMGRQRKQLWPTSTRLTRIVRTDKRVYL